MTTESIRTRVMGLQFSIKLEQEDEGFYKVEPICSPLPTASKGTYTHGVKVTCDLPDHLFLSFNENNSNPSYYSLADALIRKSYINILYDKKTNVIKGIDWK